MKRAQKAARVTWRIPRRFVLIKKLKKKKTRNEEYKKEIAVYNACMLGSFIFSEN